MDLEGSLPVFVVAVVLISASPGQAMALIVRRAASCGWRGAMPTVVGLEAALYVWALVGAAGFTALVAASGMAFLTLRVVGAVVLVYLGARAWRAAWRRRSTNDVVSDPAGHAVAGGPRRTCWWPSARGAVVQLANPKAAVFMIAFYPRFVPADRPLFVTTAGLAPVQVLIESLLYLALAGGVDRARGLVRQASRPQTWGDDQWWCVDRTRSSYCRHQPMTGRPCGGR